MTDTEAVLGGRSQMRARPIATVLIVAVVALALGACSNLRQQLGLGGEKRAPDEFSVTTYQPLALPPDYTLRPPRPGEGRPQETAGAEAARSTVFRDNRAQVFGRLEAEGRTRGEVALLSRIGAEQSNPEIRSIVDTEADEQGYRETIDILREALR